MKCLFIYAHFFFFFLSFKFKFKIREGGRVLYICRTPLKKKRENLNYVVHSIGEKKMVGNVEGKKP